MPPSPFAPEPVRFKVDPAFGYGAAFRFLEQAFRWGGAPAGLVLDLSAVARLDDSALLLLDAALERCQEAGVSLELTGLHAGVELELETAELGEFLGAGAEPA